jgi:hypothetical protein
MSINRKKGGKTYSLSLDESEGKILLKVAIVRATLFNTVLQHFSMNIRTTSPLFSPEKAYKDKSSKSFSSLTLLISRNSLARSVEDSPSLHKSEADSSSSLEVTWVR